MPRPSPRGVVLLASLFLLSACAGTVAAPPPPVFTTAPQRATIIPTPTASPTPTQAPAPGTAPQGQTVSARVISVTDGDTIRVEIDGSSVPLRYIGMDTPETVSPNEPVQWMGPESTAANKALVEGQTVVLERDVSDTDRFDRLLRYVWIERGGQWLMVNRELVLLGFAISKAYPPDTKYQSLLNAAQREAHGARVGRWGPTPAPVVTPIPNIVVPIPPSRLPVPTATPPVSGNCDPSYPTVCIPPAPPDLNCGDITFRRFQVLAPDPHGFDGDHDGVGCESG